jgi:hypothetical protein
MDRFGKQNPPQPNQNRTLPSLIEVAHFQILRSRADGEALRFAFARRTDNLYGEEAQASTMFHSSTLIHYNHVIISTHDKEEYMCQTQDCSPDEP